MPTPAHRTMSHKALSARTLLVCAAAFAVGATLPASPAPAQSSANNQQGTAGSRPANGLQRSRTPAPTRTVRRGVLDLANSTNTRAPEPPPSSSTSPSTPPPSNPTPPNAGQPRPTPGANLMAVRLPDDERRSLTPRRGIRFDLPTPSTVASTSIAGGTRVVWNETAQGESGFLVQRSAWNNGRWSRPVEVVLPANTEQLEEQLTPGLYAYRIATIDDNNRSWFGSWTRAIVALPDTAPVDLDNANSATRPVTPATPAQLTGSDQGLRTALLTWRTVPNATSYVVERSPAFTGGARSRTTTTPRFEDVATAGTFRYRVRAVNNAGNSPFTPWSTVVLAEVAPAQPADLTASDAGDVRSVRLRWSDRSDNESGFRIERQTRAGDAWGSTITKTTAPNASEQIDVPGPGEHRYRIAAINIAGVSAASEWTSVTIASASGNNSGSGPSPTPDLDAPTNLAAASIAPGAVRLAWTSTESTSDAYEVEREPSFPEGLRNTTTPEMLDNVPGGTFAYRVRATRGGEASPFTDWASVTVQAVTPPTPANVALRGETDALVVTWTDTSDLETGFGIEVERRDGASWAPFENYTVLANQTSLRDGATPGTYRARVLAYNAAGTSLPSPWAELTIQAPADPFAVPPAAPASLSGSEQNRRAAIAWVDSSTNELGFTVERTPPFPQPVTVGANVSGYIDTVPAAGTYSYRVRAFNNAGTSEWSNSTSVTIAEAPPALPGGLRAIDAGDQSDVRVSWTDLSSNEQGFRIERASWTNGAWSSPQTISLPANATEWRDDNVGMGRFRYRLSAFNAAGDSGWTEFVVVNVTNGWTQIVKSPDTREVFISSSQGNDANDGLSPQTPVRTFLRAYDLMRDGMPDHLRLRRGDVWTNQGIANQYGGWDKRGRSAEEPMVFHTYGDAPDRPLLRAGDQSTGLLLQGNDNGNGNLWIVGLHFQANRRIPGAPDFNPAVNSTAVRWFGLGGNLLIEDCKFEFFPGLIVLQSSGNENGGPPHWVRNITLRRSVLVDSYATTSHAGGLYATMIDGLLVDECVFDRNGWYPGIPGAHGTIFNHNMYVTPTCTNVMVRNTITARAAATGVQLRGRRQDAFNNLSLDNPLGITGGHAQMRYPDQAWRGQFRYNVVLGSDDIGNEGEPNFAPRGFGIGFGFTFDSLVEKNIIAHNTTTVGSEPALVSDTHTNNAVVRHNIIYNWSGRVDGNHRGLMARIMGNPSADFQFTDNVLQQPVQGTLVQIRNATTTGTWRRNKHFSASRAEWWFSQFMGEEFTYQDWLPRSGQSGLPSDQIDRIEQVSFPDPNRTIATYMASLGFPPAQQNLEAFLAEARKQSRTNWRPEFTAAAVNRYIREGFAMDEPTDQ